MDNHESIPLQPPSQGAHPQSYFQPYDLYSSPEPTPPLATTTASGLPILTDTPSSWDAFSGIKHVEQGYSAQATNIPPITEPVTFWHYLFNTSIVTRWIAYILPLLALLWLPGILGLSAFPNASIWGVKLIWWSVWLSVVWGGWWAALALSLVFPRLARWTIGALSVAARRYIAWLAALPRYIALFLWSLASWISYQPLIDNDAHMLSSTSSKSRTILSFIAKLLFGIFLCTTVLLAEKFAIQFIAGKFHEKSYAERIEDQKRATQILVVLYENSKEIKGRSDVLPKGSVLKKATKAFSGLVDVGNTAFFNLASELVGSAILQPNSPPAIVADALSSVNKSRLLARRIFYSFVQPGRTALVPADIAKFFSTREMAEEAFALFDKDGNGDVTRDEVELACMDCHREQLSIANSMKDLDSAVGRLDNIFMSLYSFIAVLIIAVVLDSQLTTLLTGIGAFILGLSWLIGSSLADVLTSIIFLFIKHPYDVGDRVIIDGNNYTVKEIMLLSTIFLDLNNTAVQAPHSVLNDKYICNIRRSPTMSETFTFDVAYDTTFEQLEQLHDKMVAFVTANKRDFLPSFDINVMDIPDQSQMTLSADIKYKSNWQQGALKSQRRNKWLCTLKQALSESKIYGPGGAGKPPSEAGPTKFTQVPWEEVKAAEHQLRVAREQKPASPVTAYRFSDKNAVLLDSGQDVFGEAEQLAASMPSSVRGTPAPRPGFGTLGQSSSSGTGKM